MAGLTKQEKNEMDEIQKAMSAVSLNVTSTDDESMIGIITHVLFDTEIPVSLSFLNVTFASLGRKNALSEKFLLDNYDIFSLSIIGSDLKISLRHASTTPPAKTKMGDRMFKIINKDQNLISRIQNIFRIDSLTDLAYDDFAKKFSSNKFKVNLSFLVRNSHVFELFTKSNATFVKMRTLNYSIDYVMPEKEIWESIVQGDFRLIFLHCLSSLLQNFHVSLPQGNLQSCFCYGGFVIDRGFLKQHRNLFLGGGVDGILLNRNNLDLQKPTKDTKAIVIPKKWQGGAKNLQDIKTDTRIVLIESAIREGRSVIVLGNCEKPFLIDLKSYEKSNQLKSLVFLKEFLEKEINHLSK